MLIPQTIRPLPPFARLVYGSVCSGIEAATVAWEPLGWKPAFFSEIDPFPSAVLAEHYPTVPNLGDMTNYKEWPDAAIDVLVGGTPCQSFSVAGLRKGLADPRGSLMLTFGAIAAKYRPSWLVWENVPGVLSSNGGRDFGTFLGMLGELGYGFAYRVLDAQYFGVAQRRRRVFVVGYLGDWRRAAAVLFERESLSGRPAPCREAGERVAPTVTGGPPFSRTGNERVECEAMVVSALTANGVGTWGADDNQAQAGHLVMATWQGPAEITRDMAPTLNCNHEAPIVTQYGAIAGPLTARHDSSACADRGQNIVAFPANMSATQCATAVNVSPSLMAKNPTGVAGARFGVRRLTPVECERLQGFPDNYTRIPWRRKPAEKCPDGPRYKALGNSMAVPVMRWIGRRIVQIEDLEDEAC